MECNTTLDAGANIAGEPGPPEPAQRLGGIMMLACNARLSARQLPAALLPPIASRIPPTDLFFLTYSPPSSHPIAHPQPSSRCATGCAPRLIAAPVAAAAPLPCRCFLVAPGLPPAGCHCPGATPLHPGPLLPLRPATSLPLCPCSPAAAAALQPRLAVQPRCTIPPAPSLTPLPLPLMVIEFAPLPTGRRGCAGSGRGVKQRCCCLRGAAPSAQLKQGAPRWPLLRNGGSGSATVTKRVSSARARAQCECQRRRQCQRTCSSRERSCLRTECGTACAHRRLRRDFWRRTEMLELKRRGA